MWDDRRVELLESGDFWLSETPEVRGSKSWGASLPRVATWAAFAVRGHEGRFAVVNAHLDHLSERARFESAKLLATRANALADDGTRVSPAATRRNTTHFPSSRTHSNATHARSLSLSRALYLEREIERE